jgi:hypothetical protein
VSKRPPKRRGTPRRKPRQAEDPAFAEVKDAILSAVAWMSSGQKEKAADAISAIVGHGPRAVHVALFAWAKYSHEALNPGDATAGPDDVWGVEVIDQASGKDIGPDAITAPGMADAARLIACAANGDHDMIAAIVGAAWDDPARRLPELLFASLSIAVAALPPKQERS